MKLKTTWAWMRWALAWTMALLVGCALIWQVGRTTAESRLKADASRTATSYAHLLSAAVPGLGEALHKGEVGEGLVERLRDLGMAGTIFRFKLFDQQGRLLLVSDRLQDAALGADGERLGTHHGGPRQADAIAAKVLGGEAYIALKDGSKRVDRPPVYSEAYVPIRREGQVVGVVEVYVDQTSLRAGWA